MWDEYWFCISAIWLCPAYVTARVFVYVLYPQKRNMPNTPPTIDEISCRILASLLYWNKHSLPVPVPVWLVKNDVLLFATPKQWGQVQPFLSLFHAHTNSHMHISSVPVPSKDNEPPPRASTLLKAIAISSLHPHKGKIWFACGSTHWSISKPFMQK